MVSETRERTEDELVEFTETKMKDYEEEDEMDYSL
jgi:hypothetical protein